MAQRRLLTDDERQALFGIPHDADDMARRFTLSHADQELVAARRRDANRMASPSNLRCSAIPASHSRRWNSPLSHWSSGWRDS
jgi:hypothetical protein